MMNVSGGNSQPSIWGGPEKITGDVSGVRPGEEDKQAADASAGNQPSVRGHPEETTATTLRLKGGGKLQKKRANLAQFHPAAAPPPPQQQLVQQAPLAARFNLQMWNHKFTNAEKTDMFKVYIRSNENSARALGEYKRLYPTRSQPHRSYFRFLDRNLKEYGCFEKPRQLRRHTATDDDSAVNVLTMMEAYPTTSLRQMKRDNISSISSASRILKKYRYLPYKPMRVQKLYPGDNQRRLTFARRMIDENVDLSQIIWSDESSFGNQGGPNRQNTRHWSQTNTHEIIETKDQRKYSINVWCGLVDDQLLGPHFLDGTLTGDKYLYFLKHKFRQMVRNLPHHMDRKKLIFHQDGAPAHTSKLVKRWLSKEFGDRIIQVNRHVNPEEGPLPYWPPRSPDTTPLDFYLWGYLKNIIYKNMPPNAEAMKQRVREECAAIPPEQIRNACTRSVKRRLEMCIQQGGGHYQQLLTKRKKLHKA